MDLAKIRKKSLQNEMPLPQVHVQPEYELPADAQVVNALIIDTSRPTLSEGDMSQQAVAQVVPQHGMTAGNISAVVERTSLSLDPLEMILAGRRAAGCDDEASSADDDTSVTVSDDCLEFLCFRVSDEIYGINIMDIKEIIKPREVTEVPRSPAFISGVLSLRGTIIPIIDMRVRLGLTKEPATGRERIVVIRNNESFSGLLVDEVIQVVRVRNDAVEPAPAVLEGIDRDFVSGIGRSDGRLIIILNLESIADIQLS